VPDLVAPNRLIFVSHSGRATWVAKQIKREIEECGAQCFLDEAEINVGADFEEDILSALNNAHELVVLLTPWSLDRPYVWAEIGVAWGRKLPIVTILYGIELNDLQSNVRIPLFLKKRNLLELNDIQTYFDELRVRTYEGFPTTEVSDV
jgi:hypothetical protein